jgi:aminoglycoside 3-N-acetyltransferase
MLDEKALRWSGAAGVAFLYAITRMKGAEVLSLARYIREQVLASVGKDDFLRIGNRAVLELKSLVSALPKAPCGYDLKKPEEYYQQGVSRRTGMWPEVADGKELQRLIGEVKKALTDAKGAAAGSQEIPEAARKVPLALQKGFLNFDDHVTDAKVNKLKKATGLGIGWSTETWAWMPDTCFDGKHTVAEVAADLQSLGLNVDVNRVAALAGYLEDIGLVRMRPVLTKAMFVKALKAIGVKQGASLMVHSSLSAYGYVEGGAATVVEALREVLGPKGTLLMPTHSNNLLGTEPYHPVSSKSNVGAVSEYFRKLPGVIRGAHPTHSVAGIGPAAAELVGSQRVEQAPLARDGFWGRFYDAQGDVLLLCPIRSATAFHVGEKWIELPQPSVVIHALDGQGRRRVHTIPNAPWHVNHFESTMAHPLMKKGIMKSAKLGESTLFLAPVRAMIDISIEVNRRNPLVSLGKNGACDCFYCHALKEGVKSS